MASATAPIARLFSRDEFQRLVDSGFFAGEKVELLDGAVITMSPQNTPHAATVNRLNYQLMKLCGPEVYIRVQSPMHLTSITSQNLTWCFVLPIHWITPKPILAPSRFS